MKKLAFLSILSATAVLSSPGPEPRSTLVFSVANHTTSDVAVSAGGRRFYYWQDTTRLYLFDRATRRFTRILDNMTGVGRSLAVSPAGDRLAFTRSTEGGKDQQLWTVALDPATGLAVGEPRHTSTLSANGPTFSPDGKSIAFATTTSRTTKNLVVVPVSGGPERVLAQTGGDVWPIVWAKRDSIYFGISFDENANAAKNGVYRMSISGGAPQLVLRTADWGNYPGLSPDGRFLLGYVPTWDSLIVATASGRRLQAYPADWLSGAKPDIWSAGTKAIGSRAKALHDVRVLDLSTGQERSIVDSAEAYVPTWSPDGRRVAAAISSPPTIVVTDLAAGKRTAIHVERRPWVVEPLYWSPDGRFIAYRNWDSGIDLLDQGTSKVTQLVAKSGRGPWMRWRSDSRAFIYAIESAPDHADSMKTIDVHEVALDGRDRMVGSVRARCSHRPACGKIVDDSLLSTWEGGEYRLTNFRDHGTPRVAYRTDGGAPPVPTFSSNGRWMAIRHHSASDTQWSIEVMHADGSAHRSVSLSFPVAPGGQNPWISDDGGELVVAQSGCGSSTQACQGGLTFHRVKVATGSATVVAKLPRATLAGTPVCGLIRTNLACWVTPTVSNDGRSLAYSNDIGFRSDFYEVDFSNVLRGAVP